MTNVRLSTEERAEILKAIELQIRGAIGVVANPAAFLRDAGLKEARRIIAEHGKRK